MLTCPACLGVYILARDFIYINTLSIRAAKALASLRKSADSPEPSSLNNAISAKSHVLILHAKMVDFYNGVKLYLYWPRHHKTLLIQPKKNDLIFLA